MGGAHCVYPSLADGHVGCLHPWLLWGAAVMWLCKLLESLLSVLWGRDPQVELRGHVALLFLSFAETTALGLVSDV